MAKATWASMSQWALELLLRYELHASASRPLSAMQGQ